MKPTSWTALYIAGLLLAEILIHASLLLSLLRSESPPYWTFHILGLFIAVPALFGLGYGFRMARKDSIRDAMAHTLPAGLLGGALGFAVFYFFPGFPEGLDLAFVIWVLVFIVSFALFLLTRQLYRRHKFMQSETRPKG